MKRELWRGFAAGALAGLALVALMYVLGIFTGLQPLTQLLEGPILAAMPGPVFGFLIDRLQHAGKVVEEFGLIIAMVVALALLGAFYVWLRKRRPVAHLALVVGAAGWLVTVAAVLPITGDGFLGLNEGFLTPLYWGLLFGAYGLILEAAEGSWLQPSQDDADPGRRRLLLAPLAVAGLSAGFLGVRLLPGWLQAVFSPPESGISGPTPEITPVADFYVVSKNFADPVLSAGSWSLNLHGQVDHPFRLTLDQLRTLPATTEVVTLECISNLVGGALISTGEFGGVALRDLISMAGPQATATTVAFHAHDGYEESLPLAEVMGRGDILVAHSLAGGPLPARHGFPARILIPGRYGMKGPKWLEEIELISGDRNGYWENQGWNRDAVVRTTARIDSPRDGALISGQVEIAGVAFAGTRGVSAVEVSPDGGRSWAAAQVQAPPSPLSWSLWSFTWSPGRRGEYTLLARARDGGGALQSAERRDSYPSGASGYHTIRVSVS